MVNEHVLLWQEAKYLQDVWSSVFLHYCNYSKNIHNTLKKISPLLVFYAITLYFCKHLCPPVCAQ